MNIDQDKENKRRRNNESMSGSPSSTPLQQRKSIYAPTTPSQTPVARKLTFTNLNPPAESIKVYLRVRPFAQDEEKSEVNCITHSKGQLLTIKAPKPPNDESKFTFTSVFPPETSQKDLFKNTALPLVESFLQGHNGLLFAYGITNAGKTYTITGKTQDNEEKGLLPRILDVIFNSIKPQGGANTKKDDGETARVSMDPNMTHWIWLTYYEIYNDKIYDLLNVETGQKKLALTLQKDENGKAIGKVNEVAVKTRKEAEECINIGMKARQTGATALNGDSSRSHAMLTIRLFQYTDPKDINNPPELIRANKLSIVDLAGSERNQRTQTTGTRLKEAGNINNSLMTLGMCLETLRWNQENPTKPPRIVPFRNSKLTRCLQDFFLKEAKVVMMVNVNPCGRDFEETSNVLKFAAVAKEITTTTRLDTRRPALATTTPATIKKRKATDIVEPEAPADGEEVKKERSKREEAEKAVELLKQQLESEKLAMKKKQETEKEQQQKETQILKQRDDEIAKLKANREEEYKQKDVLIATLRQALEEQEMVIREEVAQEMAETICQIESQYRIKMAEEMDSLEEVHNKKIDILTKVAEVIEQANLPIALPSKSPPPADPEQAEKYQKQLLLKQARINELEAALADSNRRVVYLNEKIATLSNNKDQDSSYLRSKMEQEILETRLQLETSCKAEIDIVRHQMALLRKEKEVQQEEIKVLKERIEELTRSGHKEHRTPSKLHKIVKYGIVDKTLETANSTTTIWKGDVATSVSGNGISVTFTDVETLTPHKVSQYHPTSSTPLTPSARTAPFEEPRFEDPMQDDGPVMKEARPSLIMKESRPSWSDITITPPEEKKKVVSLDKKAKGKDKEKVSKKKKKQEEEEEEEEEESHHPSKPVRAPSTRTIMSKIAHSLNPHTTKIRSPMRTSPPGSPFRAATPPLTRITLSHNSPLSPKDPNVAHHASPHKKKEKEKEEKKDKKADKKDKENVDEEAMPSVKSRRKLFDKAANEKGKFSEQLDDVPINKRKQPEVSATPIARRLRSRK